MISNEEIQELQDKNIETVLESDVDIQGVVEQSQAINEDREQPFYYFKYNEPRVKCCDTDIKPNQNNEFVCSQCDSTYKFELIET